MLEGSAQESFDSQDPSAAEGSAPTRAVRRRESYQCQDSSKVQGVEPWRAHEAEGGHEGDVVASEDDWVVIDPDKDIPLLPKTPAGGIDFTRLSLEHFELVPSIHIWESDYGNTWDANRDALTSLLKQFVTRQFNGDRILAFSNYTFRICLAILREHDKQFVLPVSLTSTERLLESPLHSGGYGGWPRTDVAFGG